MYQILIAQIMWLRSRINFKCNFHKKLYDISGVVYFFIIITINAFIFAHIYSKHEPTLWLPIIISVFRILLVVIVNKTITYNYIKIVSYLGALSTLIMIISDITLVYDCLWFYTILLYLKDNFELSGIALNFISIIGVTAISNGMFILNNTVHKLTLPKL